MVKILLLSDYSREPERRLLRGFVKYANTSGGCSLFPVSNFIQNDPARAHEIVEKARSLGVDAIFGRWPGIDIQAAKSLGIPIVLRTVDTDYPDFPMLSGEYCGIGRMAGEYFRHQGYTSYAFFGFKDFIWSDRRCDGFKEAVSAHGTVFSELKVTDFSSQWDEISRWISGLPKPVGVCACNDVAARTICEICQTMGISVPEEVAILGIDDDEFLCNISSPGISSLRLDFERQGYELGEALFRMVREGIIRPERIPVRPIGITERGSTLRRGINDPYVKQIVDFIDSNYTRDISIEEITSGIPLSRRAIELRVRKELFPRTILSYLTELRVKHLCELLTTTDLPVSEAASESGFIDTLNMGRTFKKHTGLTPTAWRNLKRKENN